MDVLRFSRDEHNSSAGQEFTANGRRYILAGKVGNGAIGFVRKARDLASNDMVAVKFLAPEIKYIDESSFEDIHVRFHREGQRGAALFHDNLVRILAYEENENGVNFQPNEGPHNPFIVMEYIQGRTVEDHIKIQQPKASFNINPQTLHIALCIVKALRYLHERGIVHRDIKPANVYLTKVSQTQQRPPIVKLGDFGVVKWGDFKSSISSGTLTMSGQQGLGTFKYMSPEQAIKPKDVGVKSDMYSLGITLFELFTNQILPTPHHVFEITRLRYQRSGNTVSRLNDLGLGVVPGEYENLFSKILDMFLPGYSSRPSSTEMEGMLRRLLEVRTTKDSEIDTGY
jgi:serine/threonine protein kinase